MTTNHIDQLAQWWENAEEGPVGKGDLVIKRHPDGRYTIREAEKGWETTNYRILSRAPKPKPAWHDAVAVIATFRDEHGMVTGVWVPEGQPGYWEGPEGDVVASDLLEDVTPMIEARVTDETLARVEAAFTDDHDSFDARIRAVTAAALGLDPEPAGRSTGPHLHYDAKENA